MIDAAGKCPVCGEPVSFYIDDPDVDGEMTVCEGCGANLRVSFPVEIEVDDIKVVSYSMKFECPRCYLGQSLQIQDEESSGWGTACEKCDATLSLSWSNWGYEAGDVKVEATVTITFGCPRGGCYNSVSLEVTKESGDDEVECDSCAHTLSVSWSDWGDDLDFDGRRALHRP